MVDEFEEKNRLAAAYIYSATSSARKDTPSPELLEQNSLIRTYAEKNRIDVIQTYADACGIRNDRERLVTDITSGSLECDVLLMRDITRWGRFSDPDEILKYEILCQNAGIDIIYLNEIPTTMMGIDAACGGNAS